MNSINWADQIPGNEQYATRIGHLMTGIQEEQPEF